MSSINRLLVSGASGSLITRVLGTGLAFGAHALIARLVGAQVYGDYFFALTIINILALIGKLGLDTATLRFVPTLATHREWGLIRGFFHRMSQLAWLTSILLACAVGGAVFFMQDQMSPALRNAFWVACLVLPATVIIQVRSAGVQAFKRVVLAQIPPEIIRPVALVLLIGSLMFILDLSMNASFVMAAELASLTLAILVCTFILGKVSPAQIHSAKPSYQTRDWIMTSLPLSLVSGLLVVLNQTGILMVGAIQGTTESGIFGVAARVATLIGFGLNAVNSIAAPMISELYWNGRTKELQQMITQAALGILAFSLPVCLGVIVLGKYILSLFGPEFTQGYTVLVILTMGQLINALAGPTGFLMTMTGHHKEAARIISIGVALNILFSLFLIPALGLVGAALATAGAIAYWNITMYLYVKGAIGVDSTLLALVRNRS